MLNHSFFSVTVLVAILQLGLAETAASGSFERLDTIRNYVHVSGDGRVIVWTTSSSVVYRQADGEAVQSIGDLPGGIASTVARDVDFDGDVIVGSSHSGWPNHEAFRWTLDGGMEGLGDLSPLGNFSIARSTSDDGSVVVGYASKGGNGRAGFLWRSGSMEALPLMIDAHAVNADGTDWAGDLDDDPTVVAGVDSQNSDPIWWTQDVSVAIPLPPGGSPNALVQELSRDGRSLLFNRWVGDPVPHYWQCESISDCASGEGVFSTLTPDAFALATTPDTSVAVGQYATAQGYRAALWNEHGALYDLNNLLANGHGIDLQGCILTSATDISHDGRVVVGIANCPGNGTNDGWVARLGDIPLAPSVPVGGLLASWLLRACLGFAALCALGARDGLRPAA